MKGGVSICNEERISDVEQEGTPDEDSYDEEEVGNDDEVTVAVKIGGGSEEDRGLEEELERSGMGSDEILEYMEENCKCCFLLYSIVFSNQLA